MLSGRESKKKKKGSEVEVLSWQQKKELADREEEEAMEKEINELISWANMMEPMEDDQLLEYLKNVPESSKSVNTGKAARNKKVQRNANPGSSSSSSQGLMASVWKFHKEDE